MNQDFNTPDALPQGTQIGQDYTILRVLGQGSFGITYLAQDEVMGGEVVIKENMPCDFAARDHDTLRLAPRPKQDENCTWACECFLNEASLLHRLSHPNIVPVTRAFSALNTAYYVMPHVGATELGEAVRNNPENRSEAYLITLLRQLLDALDYLHGKDLLHRDLKPTNILMSKEGVPIIIDFGAAHAMVSIRTRSILASPGYAPFEQLQSNGNVGPWTDLYALGATFYFLITGKTPPHSADRMAEKDPYEPLSARADLRQQYSRRFLEGIDKALALRPKNRWMKAKAWAKELPADKAPKPTPTAAQQQKNTPPAPVSGKNYAKVWIGISAGLALLLLTQQGYISRLNVENAKLKSALQQISRQAPPQLTAEECWKKGCACQINGQDSEAVSWYRKAAAQGYANAQCDLGYMYKNGQGVTQDYTEAVNWFREAAVQGHVNAQNYLGAMYTNGQGVAQDYTEAVNWYRKAAEQGLAQAQYNLGELYYYGKGVSRDITEAIRWYRKAADQGNTDAQQCLHALEQ